MLEMKSLAEETVRLGRPAEEAALDHLLLEVLEAGREPVMTAACAEICGVRETLIKRTKQRENPKAGRKGKKRKSTGGKAKKRSGETSK